MSVTKLFSRLGKSRMWDVLVGGVRRFPVSIVLLLLWAVTMMMLNHRDHMLRMEKNAFDFFVGYFFPTAAMLATAMVLVDETARRSQRWLRMLVPTGIWAVAVWAFTLWLPFSITESTALGVLALAICVLMFTSAFRHATDDLGFWKFMLRCVAGVVVTAISVALLMGGCMLLLSGCERLFGFNLKNLYVDIIMCCWCFIAPTLWLQLLPSAEGMRSDAPTRLAKFVGGIARFLFVPLLTAYLLVLYVYLFKIVLAWQLPNGMVTTLVSALMGGMLLVQVCLYPSRFDATRKFDRVVLRIMPVAVLPLLVLMSVGIGRRLADYGLTVSRLYVLAFNLWSYGVCLWLILRKGSRILWIPVSLVAVAFVTSVGPQNLSSVTKRVLLGEVKEAMAVEALPITSAHYNAWLKRATATDRKRVLDKLSYMVDTYERTEMANVVDSTTLARILIEHGRESRMSIFYSAPLQQIDDLHSYSMLVPVDHGYMVMEGDSLVCTFEVKTKKGTRDVTFHLPIGALNNDSNRAHPFYEDGNCLMLTSLYYRASPEVEYNISGVILLKVK